MSDETKTVTVPVTRAQVHAARLLRERDEKFGRTTATSVTAIADTPLAPVREPTSNGADTSSDPHDAKAAIDAALRTLAPRKAIEVLKTAGADYFNYVAKVYGPIPKPLDKSQDLSGQSFDEAVGRSSEDIDDDDD